MRAVYAVGLLAFLCPASALAQTMAAPAPSATPAAPAASSPAPASRARGGDITRDDYVQRAVDRAKRAAERRFDAMDTDHDGVLTADERRAYRASHSRGRSREEPEAEPTATPKSSQ